MKIINTFSNTIVLISIKEFAKNNLFGVVAILAIGALGVLALSYANRSKPPRRLSEEERTIQTYLTNKAEIQDTRYLTGVSGDEPLLAPNKFARELAQGHVVWLLNDKPLFIKPEMAIKAYRALIIEMGNDSNKAAAVANLIHKGSWIYIQKEMEHKFSEKGEIEHQIISLRTAGTKLTIQTCATFKLIPSSQGTIQKRDVFREISFDHKDLIGDGTFPSLRVSHNYRRARA